MFVCACHGTKRTEIKQAQDRQVGYFEPCGHRV